MSEELRPCPFCGSDKVFINRIDDVYCDLCNENFGNALRHWNTRPIEDELDAELADTRILLHQLEEVAARKQDRLDAAEAKLARVREWLDAYDHTSGYPPSEALNTLYLTRKPLAVVEGWVAGEVLTCDEEGEYTLPIFVEDGPVTVIVMPKEASK